jgi:cell filamentation protein
MGNWGIDWRKLFVPALQAARNIAYLDGGTILADVIAPAVRPADEVPPHALLGGPHPEADLTMTGHWQRMLDHLDSDTGTRYTWPVEAVQNNAEPEAHHEPTTAVSF